MDGENIENVELSIGMVYDRMEWKEESVTRISIFLERNDKEEKRKAFSFP